MIAAEIRNILPHSLLKTALKRWKLIYLLESSLSSFGATTELSSLWDWVSVNEEIEEYFHSLKAYIQKG
jgi:hypothetical protein